MEVLDPLELLETAIPLPDDEAATEEAPKRRRRRSSPSPDRESAEAGASSTDGTARPRRAYTRRASSDPCKQVELLEEQIETMLTGTYVLVGGAVSMVMPVTGTTMTMRAQDGAQAVITAAKHSPAVAAFLLKVNKTSSWGPLVIFVAGLVTAAAIDVGVIPPQSIPAQAMLGKDILPIFAAMQQQQMQQQAQSPNGTVQNAPQTDAAQYDHG